MVSVIRDDEMKISRVMMTGKGKDILFEAISIVRSLYEALNKNEEHEELAEAYRCILTDHIKEIFDMEVRSEKDDKGLSDEDVETIKDAIRAIEKAQKVIDRHGKKEGKDK